MEYIRRGGSGTAGLMRLPLVTLLAALCCMTACRNGEGPGRAEVTDSAGVALVQLSGPDVPLGWTARRMTVIPPAEEDGEGFFEVTDVDVTPEGGIVVLDRLGKKVLIFDEDGGLVAQYGREGSGPGEFQYPTELFVAPNGEIGVFDFMNRRVERFDSTLSPLAPDPFQLPYYGGGLAHAGSFLVAVLADLGATEDEIQVLTAIGVGDTVEVVRYVRELGGSIRLESCGMALSAVPPLFRPSTRWAVAPDGRVGVVGTADYQVDVYRPDDFTLERRIRRKVPVIQATRELARQSIGDGMRMVSAAGERVCDADEVVEKRGFTLEIPPVTRVAYSPSGELFLQRWAPMGEGRAVDVLDADGGYVGTLPPGFPFPDAFLSDGRIVATEEDDMGLTSVSVYRVAR